VPYRKFFPLARLRRTFQVIPNGIALPRRLLKPVAHYGGKFEVLFAGRLDDQKDPLFVLDVAESITRYWKSDLVPRFYIAGSGPLSERVAAEIVSRELTDKVIMLGWVADLADRYARARVLLLPSRWEACGLVLIEAAAHGCPAIASSVEGVPEVIRHGYNGLLFQQGNVAEACECIALLAQDETYWQGLADRARIYARTRDKDTMIASYLGVYRKLGLRI
jgi:glycosyltransferase involved in cell wall biosynthesis